MTPTETQVQALHTEFCRLTESTLALHYERQRAWAAWLTREWTSADLKLVIRYLKKGIRERQRHPGSLKFRNLISHDPEILDNFEEDLNAARREFNVRPPRPTFVEVEQRHGDVRRLVEVHAPDEMVNVGEVFADIRRSLESRRCSLRDSREPSKKHTDTP